jgi:predicted nucleotidyltransferase
VTNIQKQVISKLTDKLSELEYVCGLVLIGSHATGLNDEYSDLDLWVTVKDGFEKDVKEKVNSIISDIGDVDVNFQFINDSNQLGRRVFHIAGTPACHVIEVAVQPLSKAYIYTKGFDAPMKVLINKDNAVKFQELDKAKLKKTMQEKFIYLKDLFDVHKAVIDKYCRRNKFLEAYEYYEEFALQPLVASVRAVYAPTKQGFYLKHIYQDLPKEIVERIEGLYLIKNVEDIKSNLVKIEDLFAELKII